MKAAKITKIQRDGDFFSVYFDVQNPTDFDLAQLGPDFLFINEMGNSVDGNNVTLKVGDSITDEKGGTPIFGEVRLDATTKNMSIVSDYSAENAYKDKTGLK